MATVMETPAAVPLPSPAVWQGCQGRPWLTLYGLRLRPRHEGLKQNAALALIQQMLPEELLLQVLGHLTPYEMGVAACVCRQWSTACKADVLWKRGCQQAFAALGAEEVLKLARLQYRHRWRAMFLERPHLRFDGIYVSRNTYIRTGVVEWRVRNPVHLVCYFRYLRFFPDGTFLYRTTPDIVANVGASLVAPGRAKQTQHVQHGRFLLNGSMLHTAMMYANVAGTEIRARHLLRSTTPGAWNRLDVKAIISHDRGSQTSTPMSLDSEDQEGGRSHSRGKGTYVFVPWQQVASHALNNPVEKMDFYVPG